MQDGADGEWPRQYRNKTRQVIPNSIYEWKCGEEGVNFTHAAATHTPLLQSSEPPELGLLLSVVAAQAPPLAAYDWAGAEVA